MLTISSLMIVLSLHALVEATKVTLMKSGREFYVETSPQQFAAFGLLTNGGELMGLVDGEEHKVQSPKNCEIEWKTIHWNNPTKAEQSWIDNYKKLKERISKVTQAAPDSPTSYTWSDSFSEEQKDYSVKPIHEYTTYYSSKYFPPKLARVFINGDLNIFVHQNGRVVIKHTKCLFLNEKILIRGIKLINPEKKKPLFGNAKPDSALKKYLKENPIDEYGFLNEQDGMKTYTEAEYRAMQRAVIAEASSLPGLTRGY